MNSNQPLLIYNLKEILLEFTYANFDSKNLIAGSEIGAPMAAWLQKHYWKFPYENLVALVVSDNASYTKEALLIFTTGIFHGIFATGGIYINFTDILDWNYAKDTLYIATTCSTHQIRTENYDLLSIILFLDTCRSEVMRFPHDTHDPKTGLKRPPLLTEQQLLKKNIKMLQANQAREKVSNFRKIATNKFEKELILQCLTNQNARNITELDNLLALYYNTTH